MDTLFSSEQFKIRPQPAQYFREELFISMPDARRLGVSDSGQFGILSIEPLFPGPPEEHFAVRIAIDHSVEPSTMYVNQNFLDNMGFRPNEDRFWSVRSAPAILAVKEVVIELVVEQGNVDREINSLRREQRNLFVNRCVLVEPGSTVKSLSLPMIGRGYFNFRSIEPAPETLWSSTLLVFDERTTINLFVPHRKGGVDMVILVDASNSMDLSDYVGADNRVRSRLEGVRVALEALFQRRLASGSRVSRIATVVFGANTQMLYPQQQGGAMVELRNEALIEDIRASTRNLSPFGLQRLSVDRLQTNISGGLIYAAGLLNSFSLEGNEKMIVLLSDGADWTEDVESRSEGEIVSTAHDPAVLADSLHYDSQIRIHTVAISDEQALRKHEDRRYWDQAWAVPNTRLLRKVADFTEGLFFERPDAGVLAKLLDEIGEGAIYPV
jgi:hypothetical protein